MHRSVNRIMMQRHRARARARAFSRIDVSRLVGNNRTGGSSPAISRVLRPPPARHESLVRFIGRSLERPMNDAGNVEKRRSAILRDKTRRFRDKWRQRRRRSELPE